MIDGHADPAQRAVHHPRPVPRPTRCRAPGTRWCGRRTSTSSPRTGCASPATTPRPRRARPGRAALYTGTYQMNNRVVANGTPLDDRFDNVARVAGRAGYAPALFGYTDQGVDPRLASGPDDPRLSMWEGVLPGFDAVLELIEDHAPWVAWLRELGLHDPDRLRPGRRGAGAAGDARASGRPSTRCRRSSPTRCSRGSTARTGRGSPTRRTCARIRRTTPPGAFATMYDPADCPAPLPIPARRHPLHDVVLGVPEVAAPTDRGGDGRACRRSTSG